MGDCAALESRTQPLHDPVGRSNPGSAATVNGCSTGTAFTQNRGYYRLSTSRQRRFTLRCVARLHILFNNSKNGGLATALIKSLLLACLFADLQIHHGSFAAVERTQRFRSA